MKKRWLLFIIVFGVMVATLKGQIKPYQVVDLSPYTLTLPINSNGLEQMGTTAISISNSKLLSGYQSTYFKTTSDTGIVFWCPIDGATTSPGSGSDHPRTELFESAVWSNNQSASLSAQLSINQYPSVSKNIIIGQLHGGGTVYKTYPFVMLNIKSGTLTATVKGELTGNLNTKKITLLQNVALNKKLSYTITCTGTNISFTASCNGATGVGNWTTPIPTSWINGMVHFSAGDYVQDTGTNSSDGGKVTFYKLSINHPIPVPLKFTNFTGKYSSENNIIQLSWSTENEVGIKGFWVEKCTNGGTFSTIGWVNVQLQKDQLLYSFIDSSLKTQNQLYRIRQIDEDGLSTYSPIISIKTPKREVLTASIHSTSATIRAYYDGEYSNVKASLINTEGKIIANCTLHTGWNNLPLPTNAKGVIWLKHDNSIVKLFASF